MTTSNGIMSPSNICIDRFLDFLSALAIRGRFVIIPDAAAASVVIAGVDTQPPPTFPVEVYLAATAQGWIGADEQTGGMRITRKGREVFRRRRAHLAAANAASDATPATQPRVAAPAVNLKESPLTWLASRRDANGNPLLTAWEVAAGERLRSDLDFAQLTPRVTMGWSGLPISGKRAGGGAGARDLTDNVVAARIRITAALRAVGPEFIDILIDVCGHLRGLDEIARSEGWPRRSARLLLQRALSSLARHYGLAPDSRVEERIARRLRHWGADDFRPSIDGWGRSGNQPD